MYVLFYCMNAIQINFTYVMFYNVFIIEIIVSKILSRQWLSILLSQVRKVFNYNIFYSVKHILFQYFINSYSI